MVGSRLQVIMEKRKLKWWHWVFLLILIAGTVIVVRENHHKGSSGSEEYQRCEGGVFGTVYHITYRHPVDLHDSIRCVMQQVDETLSMFNPKSTLSAINQNLDADLSPMFVDVFQTAVSVNRETAGAFDITVAPLVNFWGFGFTANNTVETSDSLSTKASVDSIRQHIGMHLVSLQDNHIVKADTAVTLDCSAIAKGYGVDAVGRYLESVGVHDYMVEIGGEVRLRGCNPKGEQWNIGINRPEADDSEIQEVLRISDISMATSGNYRNFYRKGEKIYAHTIDPHTGYPVQHSLLSATVLAEDCAVADAYATSFMVLGLEGAKNVLSQHPELRAYLIYAGAEGDFQVWNNIESLISKK